MAKISMQGTERLGNFREPPSPENKVKIKLLHYDGLYIYSKLKVVKWFLKEKRIR
jgi:hypothetical protein